MGAEDKLLRAVTISETREHEQTVEMLGMLTKESLGEGALDALWETEFVDRRVRAAIEKLVTTGNHGLVRLIRQVAGKGVTAAQTRASLERATVSVSFSGTLRERGGRGGVPVPLPQGPQIELPLLCAILRRRGSADLQTQREELFAELADHFELSSQQREACGRWGDGRTRLWDFRVKLTASALDKRRDIDRSQPGVWRLTDQGRARAESAEDT